MSQCCFAESMPWGDYCHFNSYVCKKEGCPVYENGLSEMNACEAYASLEKMKGEEHE